MALGLYLHFPFCRHECAYCAYYKTSHNTLQEERFFSALETETNLVAEACRDYDHRITTIYIGGGTPSLINLKLFQHWLKQVRRQFVVDRKIEFSFEINPESNSRDLLQALQTIGVNRPVFGVQSFNTRLLNLLTRKHKLRQIHEAVYLANALGFDNFGCDLLFGLPGQTGKMLSADLDQLVDLQPPHISFYELTIEPETKLAIRVESGDLTLPDSDFIRALYQAGYEYFTDSGYERYEICSFAKPDYECRHNQNYWSGGDYLGLGPSAHSFMNGRRYSNVANLADYIDSLEKGQRPILEDASGPAERMLEAVLLGFRTTRGVDRDWFKKHFSRRLDDFFNSVQYDLLLESGHLVSEKNWLRLADEHLPLADEITRRLVKWDKRN